MEPLLQTDGFDRVRLIFLLLPGIRVKQWRTLRLTAFGLGLVDFGNLKHVAAGLRSASPESTQRRPLVHAINAGLLVVDLG